MTTLSLLVCLLGCSARAQVLDPYADPRQQLDLAFGLEATWPRWDDDVEGVLATVAK